MYTPTHYCTFQEYVYFCFFCALRNQMYECVLWLASPPLKSPQKARKKATCCCRRRCHGTFLPCSLVRCRDSCRTVLAQNEECDSGGQHQQARAAQVSREENRRSEIFVMMTCNEIRTTHIFFTVEGGRAGGRCKLSLSGQRVETSCNGRSDVCCCCFSH